MQVFNPWYKRNLRRRKVVLVIAIALLSFTTAFSQRQIGLNNSGYDNRLISYGFLIGIHTTSFQLKYSDEFVSRSLDSVYAISPQWSAGFSLGFIVNMRLSDFLDLRLLPKVAFYEHTLEYQLLDEPVVEEMVETTIVEFPLLLKYKSERRGNIRMYFVGGVKPGIEASGKNDVETIGDDNLSVREFNVSLDAGFGLDIYYSLFKFSPELRFSRGLRNMLGPDRNEFSAGISRLNTNTVTLYLLFQ